jgi:hypothetical protein
VIPRASPFKMSWTCENSEPRAQESSFAELTDADLGSGLRTAIRDAQAFWRFGA